MCNLHTWHHFQQNSSGPVNGIKNQVHLPDGCHQCKFRLHIMSGSWKIAMAGCFCLTWGILRNFSLCMWKGVKFQTWGTKMFLRKFYQQLKRLMRILPAIFESLNFFINNAKGWEKRKKVLRERFWEERFCSIYW